MSMTGFSSSTLTLPYSKSKQDEGAGINLTMTLKSLNSRFFELNCKVPFALSKLETDLIKYFKSRLHRGNIYFTIHMSNQNALSPAVKPSIDIISHYLKSVNQIQELFPIEGSLTIRDLISLPNIFENTEEAIPESTFKIIHDAVEKLTDNLLETRAKEGKALKEDLNGRISKIQYNMGLIEPRANQVIEERKKQLDQALKTAITNTNSDSSSDAQSLIIYNQLERIDIHEEIVRFKAHLTNLVSLIESPDQEKGKKIDFTLQELFREINTITSKCSDAQISNLAINIKVELEKAREQTQNIV